MLESTGRAGEGGAPSEIQLSATVLEVLNEFIDPANVTGIEMAPDERELLAQRVARRVLCLLLEADRLA